MKKLEVGDYYKFNESQFSINRITKWSYEILCKELNGMEILYPSNDDFEHFPNYFLAKVAYDDEKVFVDLEEKML